MTDEKAREFAVALFHSIRATRFGADANETCNKIMNT
jgi:hypothetical protein